MDSFNQFPSLNFLHTFESVARHLSFTNAAKELFVTQAAVSHQIKALEDYLGVKLFLREKRKVFLSDEGQKLLPSVVSGLQGIADSLENIQLRCGRHDSGRCWFIFFCQLACAPFRRVLPEVSGSQSSYENF